ncbi:MAG: recombinase family protein, partial [Elusimicrobiales bacterium]
MKAALYARVSSQGQADRDLSIPAQLKALREYADKKGWPVAAEYIDEAESARSADRPKFQEMIYDAKLKNKAFDLILVWKFSRFARNREDSILYKKLLKKHGVDVISINEPIDDTPSGHLMEAMLEAVDEFYSINLAHDAMRGLKENATRGYRNGGTPPYGYRMGKVVVHGAPKNKLVVEPAEAIIIKRMFEMSRHGVGLKEIVRALNGEGLRTRAGRPWSITVVHYILTNEAYTGANIFNRHNHADGKYAKNPNEVIVRVPNTHEAIVSKEVFETVARLMKERAPKVMHPRETVSEYLLSGMVYCKQCGAKMIGVPAKSGQFHYYVCQNYLKRGKEVCDCGFVNRQKLENAVISKLRENVLTARNIAKLIEAVNEEIIASKGGVKDEIAAMELKIADCNKRMHKLYNALETGLMELADLAPRIKDLRGQIAGLEEALRALKARQERDILAISGPEIACYVKEVQEFLQTSTLTESKAFLRQWIKRIEVDKDKDGGTIEYYMPVKADIPGSRHAVISMEKSGG